MRILELTKTPRETIRIVWCDEGLKYEGWIKEKIPGSGFELIRVYEMREDSEPVMGWDSQKLGEVWTQIQQHPLAISKLAAWGALNTEHQSQPP